MISTYNINRLSALFSEKTGHKPDASLSIIMEIFHTVADGIKESGSVKIKGFGEFTVDAGGQVVFYPDESLEERINEPFSIFEPVEVEPELTSALLEENHNPEQPTEAEAIGHETEEIKRQSSESESEDDSEATKESAEISETAEDGTDTKVAEAQARADEAERIADDMRLRIEETRKEIEEARQRVAEAERIAAEARQQAAEEVKRAEQSAQKVKYVPVPTDSGRSVLMFLLGLCVGIILGGAAVYFIPFLMK